MLYVLRNDVFESGGRKGKSVLNNNKNIKNSANATDNDLFCVLLPFAYGNVITGDLLLLN